MCKPKKIVLPNAGRFFKMFPTTISAVALGLLCSLPVSRASAAPCTLCPAEATGTAAAAGLNVHVIRNINGVPTDFTVSQGTVGSCETLFLVSQATYNPDGGVDLITHVQKIAAGNTGGKGLLTLPNGTITNVTPADMATTVVGPTAPGSFRGTSYSACTTIPGATDITDSKQMQVVSYTLTPTDINVNHGANFSFVWTNATPMLPNANQQCALSNAFAGSPQSVSIAAPPTCSIAPASQTFCQGGTATFTFTGSLAAGGFQSVTYCWQKGCPGAGTCLTNGATLIIPNAQPSDSGCYTVTATDTFGCSTNCQATLTVTPPPTCTITPPATNCPGSTATITVTGSGGTAPLFITISKNGVVVAGPTQGTTLSFNTTTPAAGVTDTYSGHVSDSSAGSTASTICVCDKSTTLTGSPIPTCTITPPATNCPGSTATITATASGGTAPLFITISKNGAVVAGPTQGTSLSFNTTTPGAGVTDNYSAHITDSSTGSTAGTA